MQLFAISQDLKAPRRSTPLRGSVVTVCCAVIIISLALAPSALASTITFPFGADTTTQAVAAVNTNATLVQTVQIGGTTASASSSAGGNTAGASVNLLTGELKVDGFSTLGFGPQAVGWEFLTFSGDGSVDFALDVEGTLQNLNANGMVAVEASVFLFDVTTWSSYFGSAGDIQFVAVNGSGSPFPYLVASDFDNSAVRGASSNGCSVNFITNCTVDQVGTVLNGDLQLTGTFNVEDDKLYLLQILLTTYTFNGSVGPVQVGDFSHTATFGFTDLDGLTFESASGQFLSQTTAVPEPASGLLLGLGLCGSWLARRRARAQTSSNR